MTLRALAFGEPAAALDSARRTIPFDYAFDFELQGRPERVVKSSVTVSIESEFAATSIGYGFAPRASTFVFGFKAEPPVIESSTSSGGTRLNAPVGGLFGLLDAVLGDSATTDLVLSQGVRLNPALADTALAILRDRRAFLPSDMLERLFQSVGAPSEEIQFRYALHDDGTGREFQSQPLLNTAGLGISNGERPFRQFATPIRFAPRTTIRLEITEVSEFAGRLQVVLHGFKVLGGAGSPTASTRTRRTRRR